MTAFDPALVVPVYDHGEAFRRVVPALLAPGWPVYVVDDGSGPTSAAILDALVAEHPALELVRHPRNRGKGAAVTSGILRARAAGHTHVLQIDSDGQHDCGDIPRFIDAARAHPERVILGRPRFDETIPLGRHVGRYVTHVCVWLETLSFQIHDSMCGFRVYPLDITVPVLLAGPGSRMDFDIEVLVRLHWRGARFESLWTTVTYPEGGHSNFRMLRDNVWISAMHTRLIAGMVLRLPKLLLRATTRRMAHAG